MNGLKTTILLAGLTGLFVLIGGALGGQGGMMIAFLVALGMNFFAYWNSDKVVLSMYGAREVGPREAPDLHGIVQELARRGNLPMPRVYIIQDDAPNAFATGRDPEHAAVAVTTGILRILSREELAGVMAHELGHVMNRDILISTIAAVIGGAITMLANFAMFLTPSSSDDEEGSLGPLGALLMMILAPLAATLIQMSISRSREYGADQAGAELAGNPLWLASALLKLERGARARIMPTAEHNPATAQMFIVNPLSGRSLAGLFSTHPPIDERVRRLRQMAGGH